MNYCQQLNYKLFTVEKEDFPRMVDRLLDLVPAGSTLLRLAFFGTPSGNEEYLQRHSIISQKINQHFANNIPAWSYVSQPPLQAPLLLEVHSLAPSREDVVRYCQLDGLPYVLVENPTGRFLYAGGFQGDVVNKGIGQQSEEVFSLVDRLLKKEAFPVNSIIRQWNYIERITEFAGYDQHYQLFNNARSAFYALGDWSNGYPAATGIGTNLGGILIDLDAVVLSSPEAYVTPIDNKLQVAAHAYSGQVLENAHTGKTTPKFERAKSLTIPGSRVVYISGTAAIRGENSLKDVGLAEQLHITVENIRQLTGDAEIVLLRVYLKEKKDYRQAAALLSALFPTIPISYMLADVCREELLIEIEGMAIEK